MRKCPYYSNYVCGLASELAKITVVTSEKACEQCRKHKPQDSPVVYSLCVSALHKAGLYNSDTHAELVSRTHVLWENGPGTELKKLIAWFRSPTRTCRCKTRIQKMNSWGPDGCEVRRESILRWIKNSAMIEGLPYVETAARMLLANAIKNARVK